MSGPRAVLMRKAEGFMAASHEALTMPEVSGVSGQWSEMTSAAARNASFSRKAMSGSGGRGDRARATVCMPKARAMAAVRRPMEPSPTMPMVRPASSVRGESE